MSLLTLVLVIALMGLIVWAITTLIPMPQEFRQAIYVLCVVFLVVFVLQQFGLMPALGSLRIR